MDKTTALTNSAGEGYPATVTSADKAIWDAMIEFEFFAQDRQLHLAPTSTLFFIRENSIAFPPVMRARATYWLREQLGRHKASPSRRMAGSVNWTLFQLEGMKGNLGQVFDHLHKAAKFEQAQHHKLLLTTAATTTDQAYKEVSRTIATIRQHNFDKTGKKPRVHKAWRT